MSGPRFRPRSTSPALVGFLGLLLVTACSDDETTTSPGDGPGPVGDVSGSWLSGDLTDNGVPASRYDITQSGSILTGEAFWRWQGGLERIGALTGTVDESGNAQWVTTLDDNGWDGVETVTARFSTPRAVGGVPRGGGVVSGTYEWRAPDGSTRESGSFSLERRPIIVPPPGTGPLGEAGYWRGALFYASPSGCHTAAHLVTMSLSSSGSVVGGSASAKPHPRGAALPDTLPEWFGHMSLDIQEGTYSVESGQPPSLSMRFVGDFNAVLTGTLGPGPVGTQYIGTFQSADPCTDSSGLVTSGTFIFNSEREVE